MVFNKLRSLLSHSRLPLRIASMNPRPKVYRVRIMSANRSNFIWPIIGTTSVVAAARLAWDSDKTVFIPLSLTKEVTQPPYDKSDPVVASYQNFHHDHAMQMRVKNKVAEVTVKAFEKEREKFGKFMDCTIMWLWFQYPAGPPPKYEQWGLLVSRDSVKWTSREIHPVHFQRLQELTWPQWMFNSVYTSFRKIIATVKDEIKRGVKVEYESTTEANKVTPLLTIPHPELTAKVTFDETIGNFRNNLRRTRWQPPAPKGHIRVSGIVQITGEKILVHVDVDATFDPAALDHFTFNLMKVRYVAFIPKGGHRQIVGGPIGRQTIMDTNRPPVATSPPKDREGLLQGAKAAIQEARKARVESGDGSPGGRGNVVATTTTVIRKNQDTESAVEGMTPATTEHKGVERGAKAETAEEVLAIIPPPPSPSAGAADGQVDAEKHDGHKMPKEEDTVPVHEDPVGFPEPSSSSQSSPQPPPSRKE
ncbi:hypothetical protein BDZ91DRAFT_761652 [Kalaharituber pfeilii]|nr:hypothetical protein BDZ91DRAFT_761652 [Kalaharituber pfeilii]